ncbi:MAG: hypothetical protein ACR2PG_01390, partial [Hyphomicrobiaceae bacterium]
HRGVRVLISSFFARPSNTSPFRRVALLGSSPPPKTTSHLSVYRNRYSPIVVFVGRALLSASL